MKKHEKQKILDLARRQLDEIIKAFYVELDENIELIGSLMLEVEYPNVGLTVKLIDNFAEKNTVFRPTDVRRFEIKIESD